MKIGDCNITLIKPFFGRTDAINAEVTIDSLSIKLLDAFPYAGSTIYTSLGPVSPLKYRKKHKTCARAEIEETEIDVMFTIWDDWSEKHVLIIKRKRQDLIDHFLKEVADRELVGHPETVREPNRFWHPVEAEELKP